MATCVPAITLWPTKFVCRLKRLPIETMESKKKVSRRPMKKALSLLLASALSVSMLTACGSGSNDSTAASGDSSTGETSTSATAATNTDTTMRALTLVSSEAFNPLSSAGQGDKPVYHALFDCLFRFDNDGNVVPMVAESYEQDGLDVTIHLRKDVKFSDGNLVTANDVVFSYNKNLEDQTLRYNMTLFSTGMEVVDDNTVLLHLANGYCKWQNILAELLYIVEESSFDENNDYTNSAPVGSGPYTLTSVDEGRKVTLTARDDYWNGAPEYKTVEVSAGVDDATALIALQTGEADLVCQIGQDTYKQAQSDANLTGVAFDGWSTEGMMVMVGDDAFRQAIFHAINRQNILTICNDGNGAESTNYFSPKVMGDLADVAPFTGYDVELAKECLAKSTVDLSQPFEIQVFDNTSANVAACVQSDLVAIGITAQISSVDANTFFANLQGGNMQMGLTAMATDMVSAEDMMSMFTPDGGYPFNISEDLINQAQTAPKIVDDAERKEAMTKLLQDLNVACPWVPLYDSPMYMVYNSRVGNVLDCSCATYAFYFGDMTING